MHKDKKIRRGNFAIFDILEADEKKLVIFYLSKGPVTLGNFPHISADVILISIGDKGLNVRIDNIIPLCYPSLCCSFIHDSLLVAALFLVPEKNFCSKP